MISKLEVIEAEEARTEILANRDDEYIATLWR
jgi:hypothetical protein